MSLHVKDQNDNPMHNGVAPSQNPCYQHNVPGSAGARCRLDEQFPCGLVIYQASDPVPPYIGGSCGIGDPWTFAVTGCTSLTGQTSLPGCNLEHSYFEDARRGPSTFVAIDGIIDDYGTSLCTRKATMSSWIFPQDLYSPMFAKLSNIPWVWREEFPNKRVSLDSAFQFSRSLSRLLCRSYSLCSLLKQCRLSVLFELPSFLFCSVSPFRLHILKLGTCTSSIPNTLVRISSTGGISLQYGGYPLASAACDLQQLLT